MTDLRTVFLAALVAVAAPAAAIAGEPPLTPYEFSLDRAGAETPEGAARLYADIRRQAARICRPLEGDAGVNRMTRDCRNEVIANAVAAVDAPLVTALWRDDEIRLANR